MSPAATKVREAINKLSKEAHPLSANGGWFPTTIVAQHAGVHMSMALTYLKQLQNAGLVARRADSSKRWSWRWL